MEVCSTQRTQAAKNMISRTTTLFAITCVFLLAGCATRRPVQQHAPLTQQDYMDLQSGWRVRVVTPILQSGGFLVKTEQAATADGTVELKTSDDFVGYQTDYYTVSQGDMHGQRIRFKSGEYTDRHGKKSKKTEPRLTLFDFPPNIRHIRILFLTRASHVEHDAAILGSTSADALDSLTKQVELSPDNCKTQAEGICVWVPLGVAVQPQKRNPENKKEWIPAL